MSTNKLSNKKFKILDNFKEYLYKSTVPIANLDTIKDNKELFDSNLELLNILDQKTNSKSFLYPIYDDDKFQVKIASKKEFNDFSYKAEIKNVEEEAEKICSKNFELSPHQQFIKNFISSSTPYNSVLLYHGLGTGKTCSAIGIAEETRNYLYQMNISQRIIIVASPNVQENFKIQLFDERKLNFKNNSWNIDNCAGKNFLKEINSISNKNITKEQVIKHIRNVINNSYLFMGYIEFANYIIKNSTKNIPDSIELKEREKIISSKLQYLFNNRLIIIDEIQNVRIDSNENKVVAQELMKLVKNTDNMKLLLLSATPMYNSYKEIIWLLNLMNINDNKVPITVSDVFDKNGKFLVDKTNDVEIGKELFMRKANGYISYVRGENPYSFPYRIWPDQFDEERTIKSITYPKFQLNNKEIIEPIKYLSIYTNKIGDYQNKAYNFLIKSIKELKEDGKNKIGFEELDTFGYNILQKLIECLIFAYPNDQLEKLNSSQKGGTESDDSINFGSELSELPKVSESQQQEESEEEPIQEEPGEDQEEPIQEEPGEDQEEQQPDEDQEEPVEEMRENLEDTIKVDPKELVGKSGLNNIIKYKSSSSPPSRYDFEFIDKKYDNIFAYDKVENYSSKIKSILDSIINSEGIILIYSQFIDGGLIPLALALESLGFTRYGSTKSLFKTAPVEKLDVNSYLPKSSVDNDKFKAAKYTMITGDKTITPNYAVDLKAATNESNKNGEDIKVILISQAGSEGIDFKCIRQVHILDPWYNMNRIEQIIGRGVRTCSHSSLPFKHRNVSIYLHGILLDDERESVDLYLYRIAENKSIKIGQVSRIIKQISIDCILNQEQQIFNEDNMNQSVKLELSNKKIIDYKVGDKPYSSICDYMESCTYDCANNEKLDQIITDNSTYNEKFLVTNNEYIISIVKNLFKQNFFYYKQDLINRINSYKKYSNEQIFSALTELIDNKTHFIIDKFNNIGHLLNIEDIYFFQPSEISYEKEDMYYKSKPLVKKNDSISYKIPDKFKKIDVKDTKRKLKLVKDDDKDVDDKDVDDKDVDDKDVDDKKDLKTEKAKKEDLVAKILFNKIDTEKLITQLENNYNFAYNKQLLVRGEDNYYKAASIIIEHLEGKIEKELLLQFIFDHLIEILNYNQNFNLINYLYFTKRERELSLFEEKIFNYYESNIIQKDSIKALIFNDFGILKLLVYNPKYNTWEEGKSELVELENNIKELIIKKEDYNLIVGFIGTFKNEINVYKIKQMDKKRNKGARCDQSGKADALNILNSIIGETEYNVANTKKYNQTFICIIQELYLRYFNNIKKDDKVWFLRPELAIINEIEKIQL
tara:strand:+ start:36 stop:4028 length:3993 start_codon:yes stop_codon:yes gene_type:complete